MKTPEKTLKYHKEWRDKNKDKVKVYYSRKPKQSSSYNKSFKLKFRYGMSLVDLEKMMLAQKNLCKICGKEKEMVIDHCHKTGRVRGLLCRLCNIGLGSLNDDIEILENAIKYLKK